MRASTSRILAAGVLALAATTVAQAASYRIVDLGADIIPTQVNKRGDMSGETYGQQRALVYRGGRWKRLPADRSTSSVGDAINAGGDVAGYTVDQQFTSHPALWLRGGGRVVLPLPGDAEDGFASGLSDDQVVVGYFDLRGTFTNHCFRWSQAEGTVDLGLMAGGHECRANAINRAGIIVGDAPVTYKGNSRAFRYENGEFRNLGTLPGDDNSAAYAINNQGHIVGTSGPDPFSGRAFLWSGGAMKDIGSSPDWEDTAADAINDQGDIVGSGFSLADDDFHALRFADGQVIALETEVEDLGDWKLNYALSVSEAGVIVGMGERAGGLHGFALVPIAAR